MRSGRAIGPFSISRTPAVGGSTAAVPRGASGLAAAARLSKAPFCAARSASSIVREGDREAEVGPAAELPLPGEHNLENALAAAAAAFALGARPEAIRAALRGFAGVPDRLEQVAILRGVEWVNNTMCTNVDAAVRSIEASERPLIVIAGGHDKGSDFDPLGRALAARAKHLIAIGTDGPRIAAAARAGELTGISEAASMREAVQQAAMAAAPGDVVLLAPACASFDWYSSFEERGRDFRGCVEELASLIPGAKR